MVTLMRAEWFLQRMKSVKDTFGVTGILRLDVLCITQGFVDAMGASDNLESFFLKNGKVSERGIGSKRSRDRT